MINELRAFTTIAKGLLMGKSLADISYEQQTIAARARYKLKALK